MSTKTDKTVKTAPPPQLVTWSRNHQVVPGAVPLYAILAEVAPDLLPAGAVDAARRCETYPAMLPRIDADDGRRARAEWAATVLAAAEAGEPIPSWEPAAIARAVGDPWLIARLREAFRAAWQGVVDEAAAAFADDASAIAAGIAVLMDGAWNDFATHLAGYPDRATDKTLVNDHAAAAAFLAAKEAHQLVLALAEARAHLGTVCGFDNDAPQWPLVLACDPSNLPNWILKTPRVRRGAEGVSPGALKDFANRVAAAGGIDITPEPRPELEQWA